MRPNIVIFNPDQMRADALAHLGNPAASTPFLDSFARTEAVSFRSAFCQNPVCVPSRCSFFTGRYPHVSGHRTMQYLLHDRDETLFSQLKAAGYYVWMNDRNDLLAGQIPGLAEKHASEVFVSGHVKRAPGPEPESTGRRERYSHFEGRLGLDAQGKNYTSDDESVDAAIERIHNPKSDQPFCMFLGLFYPHPPYQVEEPYYSMIDRKKLPRRAGPGKNKPRMETLIRRNMHMDDYTEADWDELRACYLGMCRKVDDQFHRLCQALKDAGQYDNTAIFFFSDHGDYTGDYGLPEKAQNTFEDCLTRVPLLIKPPRGEKLDAGITDSLAELVDFYATAMDYAGVKPNQDHFGKSLRPILENRHKEVRDCVFCEGVRLAHEFQCDEYHSAGKNGASIYSPYWPRQMAQTDPGAHGKATMIRDKRYKYIHRLNGEHEFYDLKTDPLEEDNIFGSETAERELPRLRMKMLDWYQQTCDAVPREYDSRMPPDWQWEKVKNACDPAWAEEIRTMVFNGAGPAEVGGRIAQLQRQTAERA